MCSAIEFTTQKTQSDVRCDWATTLPLPRLKSCCYYRDRGMHAQDGLLGHSSPSGQGNEPHRSVRVISCGLNDADGASITET